MSKTCGRCRQLKPLQEFHRNATKADGRSVTCRSCHSEYMKAHYEANRLYYKSKALRSNQRRRQELRELINKLKDRPCTDCQQSYPPFVMDFDHVRGPKLFEISAALRTSNYSRVRVELEAAKCDVVCANCHRLRTFQASVA